MNIFRTKEQLIEGAKGERYNKEQVGKLISNQNESGRKVVEDEYRNKITRFATLGLDTESNNYTGQTLFNLTEGAMTYKGEKWYILFDYKSGIWIKCVKLKEVFTSFKIDYVISLAAQAGVRYSIENPESYIQSNITRSTPKSSNRSSCRV
jgi:hypothetical protein